MSTTQTKLNKLIDTKNEIRQTLILLGVDVPIDTSFASYPDFMDELGDIEVTETTTDQDLLQLLDLYHWLGSAEYEDHTYTDEEIQAVHSLLDKINNGPTEDVEPDTPITEPYLVVLNVGRTTYYPGDKFSLDGYIIRMVYPDGNVVDVTEQCTFTPTTELSFEDELVMITYEMDDKTFTYQQPIKIHQMLTYIDTTGSQYIKSGIIPSSVSRIDMSFAAKTVDGNWRTIFFTELNGSPYNGVGLRVNTSKQLAFNNGYNSGLNPISATANLIYNIEWYRTSDTVTINGVNYSMTSAGTMVNTEWYIFANNVAGSPAQYGIMRLYYLKFYDLDGNLIRDFRPYRDFDGVVCLRDLVEEQNIYNNGSGTFVAGDLISDDSGDSDDNDNDNNHTEIEYIQSTGSQYIDTGLIVQSGYKVELDFSVISGTQLAIGSTNVYESTNNLGVELNKTHVWTRGTKYTVDLSGAKPYKLIIDYSDTLVYEVETLNISLPVSYNSLNYYLFACNENNVPSWNRGGEIYRCKIYNGNVLVRDFVPVLDVNNVACLFDNVTKSYFYNAGSGAFTAGPKK